MEKKTTEVATPERGRGRPTDYYDEIADIICERIITGLSVRKIGDMEDMPCEDTIYTWLAKHEYFSEKYEKACQHRTDKFMEECVELADTLPDGVMFLGLDGRLYERIEVLQLTVQERAEAGLVAIGLTTELINKRKLQIETRMKAAARMHRKKWGDRSEVDVTTKGDKLPAGGLDAVTLADAMRMFKESL
ncbi:hypothetical protein [Rhizobium phaseoli]|uniref:terminase small subunit-like protein n=1 Tax=Rhizobium phaseoli TaxID=396 RepID=UPI0007EC05BF|nr:hypothetical protein [Rhizobium phaseoli]